MAEQRAALLKETAGKPVTAWLKLGSERFKALSEPEKQKYHQQHEEAKQQYEKDMAAFKAAGGVVKRAEKGRKAGTKKRSGKDPNKPKLPVGGAYACFCASKRAAIQKECEGKPVSAVTKIAAERWRALSITDRQPFEEEYQKKLAAYKAAMKDYVPPAREEEGDKAAMKDYVPPAGEEEGDDDDE